MKKTVALAMALCMLIGMFGMTAVFAAGSALKEEFDYADGWQPSGKKGWTVSGVEGDYTAKTVDKSLQICTPGEGGEIRISRALDRPFERAKVAVSLNIRIEKTTGYNLCFPLITAQSTGTEGSTQMLQIGKNLRIVSDGDKTLPMTVREGETYTYGFVIDLKNKKQDLYLKCSNGEVYTQKDMAFKEDVDSVGAISFWMGSDGDNLGQAGEYYIDDIVIEEATDDTIERLESLFFEKAEASVDALSDIKAKIKNDVVLFVGSSDAYANGRRTKIDPENDEVMPLVVEGRTLVPVRFISESIGAQVGWDDDTQTVTVDYQNTNISLKIGEKAYMVNGEEKMFDVPAMTMYDRTMLPLRAVTEALGKQVFWDDRGLIGVLDNADTIKESDTAFLSRIIETFGIYVSPNGNDRNDGSIQKPYKTLESARAKMRSIKSARGIPEGGMTVYLRGGEYPVSNTFTLGGEDSGAKTAPITYRAYPGEEIRNADNGHETGTIENNVWLEDDSVFRDAANRDYTIISDTGIAEFTAPDTGKMGLYLDNYRKQIFALQNFTLVAPQNGARNMPAHSMMLRWNPAIGATYYNVYVASGKDFSDIVFEEKAMTNSLNIYGLQYGATTYYWKVEAVSDSILTPGTVYNAGGARTFTTAREEILGKEALQTQLDIADTTLKNAVVGTEAGNFNKADVDELQATVDKAKNAMTTTKR